MTVAHSYKHGSKLIVLIIALFNISQMSVAQEDPFLGTWFSAGKVDQLDITLQNLPIPLEQYDHHIAVVYGHNEKKENSCKNNDTNELLCLNSDTKLTYHPDKKSITLTVFDSQEEFYQTPPDEDPAQLFMHEFWIEFIDKTKQYCGFSRDGANYAVFSHDTSGNHAYNGNLSANFSTLDINHTQMILKSDNIVKFKVTYTLSDKSLFIDFDKFDTCVTGRKYNY